MKSLKFTILLISCLASISTCFTETVPRLINYQGKLTDAANNPLPNGTYGVKFQVWSKKSSAEVGDQLIWGQDYTVAVANGIFNVILGAPGGTPISGALTNDIAFAFGAPDRYIGFTITRTTNGLTILNATEIIPRQQVLSSPYAMQAEFAATAQKALSINLDSTTLEMNDGVARISATAAGDGVGGGGSSPLSVNVDNSTIEIASDTVRVKDGGITASKLSSNAKISFVTTSQLVNAERPLATISRTGNGSMGIWVDSKYVPGGDASIRFQAIVDGVTSTRNYGVRNFSTPFGLYPSDSSFAQLAVPIPFHYNSSVILNISASSFSDGRTGFNVYVFESYRP